MKLKVVAEELNGLLVVEPAVFADARGFFMETFQAEEFAALGMPGRYAQDNQSRSTRGVLRGLHFQWDPPQSKLVRVSFGRAWLVALDVRKGSPTLGQWHDVEATDENHLMVWAPAGFARGFCVLSASADVQYKCTGIYNPRAESGIRWDDPQLSYVIGYADPLSIFVNTFGTGRLADEKFVKLIRENFELTPKGIIKSLDLLRPIYRKTASFGHFGRTEPEFTWERIDKAEALKKHAARL